MIIILIKESKGRIGRMVERTGRTVAERQQASGALSPENTESQDEACFSNDNEHGSQPERPNEARTRPRASSPGESMRDPSQAPAKRSSALGHSQSRTTTSAWGNRAEGPRSRSATAETSPPSRMSSSRPSSSTTSKPHGAADSDGALPINSDGNGALRVGFVRRNDDARTSRTWIGRGLARLRSRCFT